jgi:hypothetical protein
MSGAPRQEPAAMEFDAADTKQREQHASIQPVAKGNLMERRSWSPGKLFCLCGVVVFAVLIFVPIPVAVLIGRREASDHVSVVTEDPTVAPTLATTSEKFLALVAGLKAISGTETFSDGSTPQYKAASWLADSDSYSRDLDVASPKFIQRYVLTVFYFSMNGDSWDGCNRVYPACNIGKRSEPWISGTDECTWLGVSCSDEGFVTRMEFGMFLFRLNED